MRTFLFALAAFGGMLVGSAAHAGTLADVKARNTMQCGVHIAKPGFSTADANGNVTGFDVDFCRAIAAAIGVQLKLVPLNPNQRFTALASGAVDMLLMTTTENMQRSTKLHADFPFINYYGGGMLMVKKSLRREERQGARRRLNLHERRHDGGPVHRRLLSRQSHDVQAGAVRQAG